MKCLLRIAIIFCTAVVAVVVFAQSPATNRSKNGERNRNPDIRVESFNKSRIIGLLGHPLGTILHAKGIVRIGDSAAPKALAGKTLLDIEEVNGARLESPVVFLFPGPSRDIPRPVVGERFDYYVHESGEFGGYVGLPKELGGEQFPPANDGFYYRRRITVHKLADK